MKECDPALVRLQVELADVGTMAEGLNQRAKEVLEALGRILPFDAGWLAIRDPERRRHVPLATTGAAEPLRRYFESPGADAEVEHLGLNSAQSPVLAGELAGPLPEICAWGEYLLPAGFRGGVAGTTQVPALAAALHVDPDTTTETLGRAQLALDAPDLTAAATRALRTGLRIPPALSRPARTGRW